MLPPGSFDGGFVAPWRANVPLFKMPVVRNGMASLGLEVLAALDAVEAELVKHEVVAGFAAAFEGLFIEDHSADVRVA